jgi:hypothetical protein
LVTDHFRCDFPPVETELGVAVIVTTGLSGDDELPLPTAVPPPGKAALLGLTPADGAGVSADVPIWWLFLKEALLVIALKTTNITMLMQMTIAAVTVIIFVARSLIAGKCGRCSGVRGGLIFTTIGSFIMTTDPRLLLACRHRAENS